MLLLHVILPDTQTATLKSLFVISICTRESLRNVSQSTVSEAAKAHYNALMQLDVQALQEVPILVKSLNQSKEPVALIQRAAVYGCEYLLHTELSMAQVSLLCVLPTHEVAAAIVFSNTDKNALHLELPMGSVAAKGIARWERNGERSGFYMNGYHELPASSISAKRADIVTKTQLVSVGSAELWTSFGKAIKHLIEL